MENSEIDIQEFREKIRKGLELSFQRLLTQKKAQNGILVLSENGLIKKIRAADIIN